MARPIFIAVNQTASDIILEQLRVTVPASSQVTISANDEIWRIQEDPELLAQVNAGNILINDGTTTFNQADSIQYLATVATKNILSAVPSNADHTEWSNVSTSLGGQAGANANYVFKSDGAGSGSMGKNTQIIARRITVGLSGDVDYTSIASAITAAISGGASSTTPWEISISPGTYTEPPMTIQPGISLTANHATRIDSVFIVASNASDDLFTCNGGYIAGIRASGVTDTSKCLFRCATAATQTVFHGVSIRNCSNGWIISNGATVLQNMCTCIITGAGQSVTTFATVTDTNSYLGVVNNVIYAPPAVLALYSINPIENVYRITSDGECYISGASYRVAPKNSTADIIHADGGCKVTLINCEVSNSGNVIHIGASGTNTQVTNAAAVFTNNTLNIFNESSTGKVFSNHTSDLERYSAVTGAERTGIAQYRDLNLFRLIGDLEYKFDTDKNLNLKDFFYDYSSTGVSEGGVVSAGTGLHVDITAGEGFIRRESPYFDSFSVTWDAYTALPLTGSTTNYICYDHNTSSLVADTSSPGLDKVLLATVVTDGSAIRFLHKTKHMVQAPISYIHEYLLNTRKTFQLSGIATIQGTTNRKIDISSGTYYLALEQISVAGSSGDATFSYFYGTNGSTEVSGQTLLDITQYDNAGTLTTMTDGYYRADTVYVTSDNRISVIYGTSEYSSSLLAQAAAIANAPTFISDTAFSTAKVIVLKNTGISTIIDIRPSANTTTGGSGGGVSIHAALAGLSADDHTQYLLASGARSMSGSLNMGSNSITNVGTVDGVTISSHASRHNPGGADALTIGTPVAISVGVSPSNGTGSSYSLNDHQHGITTGTPVSIGTSNSDGTASSVSRSDHIHNHGTQSDGYHHALVIAGTAHGFMSFTDKTKLDGIEALATNTPLSSTTPSSVDVTTGVVGVGTTAARSDHTHTVNTAAPSSIVVGGSNTTGTAVTLSRSDHIHALPAFGTTASTFTEGNDSRLSDDRTASGTRTATTIVVTSAATAPTSGQALVASSSTLASWISIVPASRTISTTNGLTGGGALSADLTISPTYGSTANTITQGNDSRLSDDRTASGLRSATTVVSVSAATAPTSGQVLTASSGTLATWSSPLALTSSSPVNITKAAASVGVATDAARSDHKHDITTAAAIALSVGGSNTEGTSSSLARSDHTHSLPAFGSAAGTFTEGNDGRLSDDRTASGLRSATTVVSISAATAPTSGQTLVASSGTLAAWVTPLSLTSSAPVNVTKAAASVGVATDSARSDHKHDVTTASASSLSVGGSNTEGTATSLSRSDHTHALPAFGTTLGTFAEGNDSRFTDDRIASGLRTATTVVVTSAATAPTANQVLMASSGTLGAWQTILTSSSPSNVDKSAAVVGTATDLARADHKHDISTASAIALSVGGSNAEGTATTIARSDHTHSLPAFGTIAGSIAQGNDSRFTDDRTASGLRSATTIVSTSAATAPTSGQVLTASSGTLASWVTPLALASAAPANVDKSTAAVGTGTTAARADHKHDITTATAVATVIGGANAEGVSTSLSRADHVHAMVGYGTTAGTIAQGNDSRFIDDRISSGIRTASTVVVTSAATAPTANQALVASSSTLASWVTVVPATRNVNTSNGITGGGALSADLTISPTYGSTANTITQGNDSRLSDDRTASGIRTATTTVSVSGATAPTIGQALVATSSTDATWQTISVATSALAVCQARRTTTVATPTTFTNITFNATDVETTPSVITHPGANLDRINVLVAGTYRITYEFATNISVSGLISGRALINNTTVIPGSGNSVLVFGGTETDLVDGNFVVTLAANDFITIQHQIASGTGTTAIGAVVTVQKLDGITGATGPAGSGSTIIVKDEGVNVTNTPHSEINFTGNVTATDAGAGVVTVAIPLPGGTQVTGATNITTTSATDVLMTGMTATPAAGNYLVWFTGDYISTTATTMVADIWVGGVVVTASERPSTASAATQKYCFSSMALVTVNGAQAIEGRWRRTAGTMTNTRRTLMYLKVA